MSKNLAFPDPAALKTTRAEVFSRLKGSLGRLAFDLLAEHAPVPVAPAAFEAWFEAMDQPPPSVFAVHAVLLDVALKENWTLAPQALSQLQAMMELQPSRQSSAPCVTSFSVSDMEDIELEVLTFAYQDDVGYLTNLVGSTNAETEEATSLIGQALDILEHQAPCWHAELLLLTNHFFLASPPAGAALSFGGASVFDAYGSVLVNPRMLRDIPSTLMTLIHESSHQHMFLFHLDDPILLNPPEATFSSPLRSEPRPMEGIFHALWVSAREALMAEALLMACGQAPWHDELMQRQAKSLSAFHDLEAMVREHAVFTDLGSRLFADVRDAIHGLKR